MWNEVASAISQATGTAFTLRGRRAIGGGCINDAVVLEGEDARAYFVKANTASGLGMFEAEAEGLREIDRTETIRVPRPVCTGHSAGSAYLVLEYLPLHGDRSRAAALLGDRLAAMHRVTAARFGWHRDNTIGSTAQINTESDDWVAFWREHRLGFQLELARENGARARLLDKGSRLLEAIPLFFSAYTPEPALLHGDLWCGNHAATDRGEPVIFDPAVYYGDREADIAMTELFGGFGDRFYHAYREAFPLDAGYATRKTLYNLYHVLNHLILFGGGYAAQAESMIDALLSEIR